MDSDPQDDLRARLSASSKKLPASLERLGNALWNREGDPLTHAECQDALSEFIEAELAHAPVAVLYPQVKHHLDWCDECGSEYAELLDLAWAEQRGAIAKRQASSRPNLGFLPKIPGESPASSKRSLPDLVLELTRDILTKLDPSHVPDLAVIAEPFLEQMRTLGGSFEINRNTAPALGFGRADSGMMLFILAGTYATSLALSKDVTPAQAEAWLQRGELERQLEKRVQEITRQIGLDRRTREKFVRAYAEQIAQNPALLRELLGK